jgi:hypothetical protein
MKSFVCYNITLYPVGLRAPLDIKDIGPSFLTEFIYSYDVFSDVSLFKFLVSIAPIMLYFSQFDINFNLIESVLLIYPT